MTYISELGTFFAWLLIIFICWRLDKKSSTAATAEQKEKYCTLIIPHEGYKRKVGS